MTNTFPGPTPFRTGIPLSVLISRRSRRRSFDTPLRLAVRWLSITTSLHAARLLCLCMHCIFFLLSFLALLVYRCVHLDEGRGPSPPCDCMLRAAAHSTVSPGASSDFSHNNERNVRIFFSFFQLILIIRSFLWSYCRANVLLCSE